MIKYVFQNAGESYLNFVYFVFFFSTLASPRKHFRTNKYFKTPGIIVDLRRRNLFNFIERTWENIFKKTAFFSLRYSLSVVWMYDWTRASQKIATRGTHIIPFAFSSNTHILVTTYCFKRTSSASSQSLNNVTRWTRYVPSVKRAWLKYNILALYSQVQHLRQHSRLVCGNDFFAWWGYERGSRARNLIILL